jgi:hypothetical protein
MGSILGSCRATPSSSRRCSWTATSRRFSRGPNARVSPQHKQRLAAIIHLCGAGPAKNFARRGFYLTAGERCGDHDVAAYLAQVNAMKQEFLRLAADTSSTRDIGESPALSRPGFVRSSGSSERLTLRSRRRD